ncbi:hypothetical protein Vafri_3828 [Volvox africanus]|uniref:CRAL-TRIO domain-containing protein n=1 Tax=Volvox africanus TaxID=51714 RepID=A0A8J4EU43_9CHLO|nr:hypothetical protein Vafri_3828 [Volvox africanus]
MDKPLDNVQLPPRVDDSDLGYAPRYHQSAESSDDLDEPLAYKMQYNSVYNVTDDLSSRAIHSSGQIVNAHASGKASSDLNSALGPAASFTALEPGALQPVGSDNSDDDDSLNRIAGYTRSASLSARTAVETAAAIAARTAALSERLSFRLRTESEQQVLHTQISTGLTTGPQKSSVDTNRSNLDAGMDPLTVAPLVAPDVALEAEALPSSFLNQEGAAGEGPATAVFQGTIQPMQAWQSVHHASADPPQALPVPDPHQSLPMCQVPGDHAELEGSGSYLAAADGTQLQQLAIPSEEVELYFRNPTLPSAQASARADTIPGAPSVFNEGWAPASAGSVPSAPPTWRKSDVRSFEDVSLELATGSAADAWQAHLPRPSGTGSVTGPLELPLDSAEVVATVEHPVFDDPDVLGRDHTAPRPDSKPLILLAAAADTPASSNADQLLDGYRIAAAAGLISPELASLLGLAPPLAEAATAAEGQNLVAEEEHTGDSPVGAAGLDGLVNEGKPAVAGAALTAALVPQLAPLAFTGLAQLVEGDTGAAVPADDAAVVSDHTGSRNLPIAALVQHDHAGDPFDAADTDDEAAEFMVRPPHTAHRGSASGLPGAEVLPRYPKEQGFAVPNTTAVAQVLHYAVQPGRQAGVEPQSLAQAARPPEAAATAAAAGIGVAMVGGAAVAAVAAANQRAVAVDGTLQSRHGPANGAISVSGHTGALAAPAAQAGPQALQQQQPQQFLSPSPYVRPPATGGPCSPQGLTLPTSMRSSASPSTAPGPQQPPHQPPSGPQLRPAGPPPPHPTAPAPGFGPQANFPAGRGPAGAPLPPAAAANSVVAPGAAPLLAPYGGAPWPQGGPGSGPFGPGPIPGPRPGLPLRPLLHPGAPLGAPRPGMPPPPGQGMGPVSLGFSQGPPGGGMGPGLRPPFSGGMMTPPPAGQVGLLRPPLAPGAAGPRPPHVALFPLPKPIPYPGLLYTEGRDTLGRPVVVLNTALLPAKAKKNDVLQYLLQELQPVVQGDYVIVVLSLAMGVKASSVSSTWALGAYSSLAKPYRKNVKHIVLVQPSAWARTLLALAQPFVSKKAAHKVKKVDNLVQISEATGGEVKLESLGGRFIREIQYGLGAPPLSGLVPTPGAGVPQRPPVPGPMVQPPRGPMPPMHPAQQYQGPPGSYRPPAPRPTMPPGSGIVTPVYGPGGPRPATGGRIQGPPPPRPQFPPGMSGPGGVGVGPQPGEGNDFGAAVSPPVPR